MQRTTGPGRVKVQRTSMSTGGIFYQGPQHYIQRIWIQPGPLTHCEGEGQVDNISWSREQIVTPEKVLWQQNVKEVLPNLVTCKYLLYNESLLGFISQSFLFCEQDWKGISKRTRNYFEYGGQGVRRVNKGVEAGDLLKKK